jgi:hypothetical protein
MRTQHAPKFETIIVALVLVLIGALGTFGHVLPSVTGVSGESIGIVAYVLATGILLLGIFLRDL